MYGEEIRLVITMTWLLSPKNCRYRTGSMICITFPQSEKAVLSIAVNLGTGHNDNLIRSLTATIKIILTATKTKRFYIRFLNSPCQQHSRWHGDPVANRRHLGCC